MLDKGRVACVGGMAAAWQVREPEARKASPKASAAARTTPTHTLEVWLPHR